MKLSVIDYLVQQNQHSYAVNSNMNNNVLIQRYPKFKKVYDNTSLVFTEGKPLLWIAKMKVTSIKEKNFEVRFVSENV